MLFELRFRTLSGIGALSVASNVFDPAVLVLPDLLHSRHPNQLSRASHHIFLSLFLEFINE